MPRWRIALPLLLAGALTLAACGSDGGNSNSAAAGASGTAPASARARHAPARLLPQRHPRHRRSSACEKGIFAKALGTNVKLET